MSMKKEPAPDTSKKGAEDDKDDDYRRGDAEGQSENPLGAEEHEIDDLLEGEACVGQIDGRCVPKAR